MNHLYLCKPGGVILGPMSGLDENSVSLTKTIGIWELTFNVSKYLYERGERTKTTYYDFISERMELYLDTEDEKVRFIIVTEPSVNNNGTQEIKTITAQSIECELQDKFLRLFDINTGQKISQENLLKDDDGRDYNLNPYTKLPIDYISVHRDYVTELTDLKDQIHNGYIEWDIMDTDDGTEQTEMKHFVLQYGSGGLITAENDPLNLFPRYISNMLRVYPRLQNNIVYGIDKRSESQTYDQEICTTESYLKIVNDAVVRPLAQFKKQKIDDKDCILDPTEIVYPDLEQSVDNLITFYQKYGHQLSMLELCLEKATHMGWTVGEVPDYIGKRKYSFSVEESAIYTFLTQTCASTMKVVFDFDRLRKKVNIIDVSGEDHEHDTGVFIGLQNLANEINIEESSEDGIRTKFLPKGANDLGITLVNFGEEEMINLDYFMHRTDKDGEHQYVSDEMREKYDEWKAYRDEEEVTIEGIPTYEYILSSKTLKNQELIDRTYSSRREAYIDLTKRYNQTMIDIDEFDNLLPDDGCLIDYTTFTFEELVTAWKAYQNALDALLQLYKEDYKVATFNMDTLEARDIHGELCANIKDTMYWHDFDGYVYTIIPNVENALKIYVYTDAQGNFTDKSKDENGDWVYYEGGNPNYNGNAEIVTENKADGYLYDMTLYGYSELDIKRQAWSEAAAQLYHEGFILEYDEDGVPTRYNTADDEGWERLITETKILPSKATVSAIYTKVGGSDTFHRNYTFTNDNSDETFTFTIPDELSEISETLLKIDSTTYTKSKSDPNITPSIGGVNDFTNFRYDSSFEDGVISVSFDVSNRTDIPFNCRVAAGLYYGVWVHDNIANDEIITLTPNQTYHVEGSLDVSNISERLLEYLLEDGYGTIRLFAEPMTINYEKDLITTITDCHVEYTSDKECILTDWDGTAYWKDNTYEEISGDNPYSISSKTSSAISIGEFTSKEDFISKMNRYLDYVSFDVRNNSLTKDQTKGVIRMAEDELEKCVAVMDTLREYQDITNELRQDIADSVSLYSWNFTDKEFGIMQNLIKEANYTNENILITNLDNIVSMIETEKELYDDSNKKLFEVSRPQYSFSVSLDNLLAIKEFEPLKSSIQLLNYIYLRLGIYEDATVKVRLVSIQRNPMIETSEIDLGFSNMVYTYDGLSDLDQLLGDMASNVSAGGSGGSSGGSGGTYGENNADVQISNNMLNALLSNNGYMSNTQMIITKTETSVGQKLENGEFVVDGAAVANLIRSNNYNGTSDRIDNTIGSIIKLDNGTFNLGGGGLVFDGDKLVVEGEIRAINLKILEDAIIDGSVITGILQSRNSNIKIDLDNGTLNFNYKFQLDSSGKLYANYATIDNCTVNTAVINNCTCNDLKITNQSTYSENNSNLNPLPDMLVFENTAPNGSKRKTEISPGCITLTYDYNGEHRKTVIDGTGISVWNYKTFHEWTLDCINGLTDDDFSGV